MGPSVTQLVKHGSYEDVKIMLCNLNFLIKSKLSYELVITQLPLSRILVRTGP